MSEEIAVTPSQDSAPVAVPDLATLSQDQRQTWRETGELPKKQDSAPASQPKADSAPQSDTAPDSESGKSQKPHLKTKEDTAKRIQELLEEQKTLRAQLEELRKTPVKREPEQKSQPAPEEIKAPVALRPFLEQYFKDNPKAQYEDGVEAWTAAKEKFLADQHNKSIQQALMSERQRIQQETTLRTTQQQFADFHERYPDVKPEALNEAAGLLMDKSIPVGVQQVVGSTENFMDVLYVLTQDQNDFQNFLQDAKTNPLNAIRKIVLLESLVKEELSGKKSQPKGDDGKFVKAKEPVKEAIAEPVTKAPRPPVEIGGRQSTPEDEGVAAVKAQDFRSAKAAWTRAYTAANR